MAFPFITLIRSGELLVHAFVFFFDETPSWTDGRVAIRGRRGDEVDWKFLTVLFVGGGFWGQASSSSHQSC